MNTIIVKTAKAKEVVDITQQINDLLRAAEPETGLCHLFSTHTTAAITTVHIDPERELDLMGAF